MRRSEKGRSMVEMLGVLAIIGVLSVGGIYGYTVAMRKYKANEIVQTANMIAVLAQSQNAGDGAVAKLEDLTNETTVAGISMDICADADGKAKQIKLANADTDLCNAITQIDKDITCGTAALSCS